MKPALCTIIAKNYLAQARALTDSFLKVHPDGRCFVLLLDEPEGRFDPAAERFSVVSAKDLGIPRFEHMLFRYNLLEMCTAVKPFFLEHLFRREDLPSLFYFDPDVLIFSSLAPLLAVLEGKLMALTPHLLEPLAEDGRHPSDLSILRAGTYNLGFLGLARHPSLLPFLRWWQQKLEKQCVIDMARGLFVDQKWMDMAPALFPDVVVHRDAGCNAAYWNLSQRRMEERGREWLVNGAPLVFFHFSGYDPQEPGILSRHQDRLRFSDHPNLRKLFDHYDRALMENGFAAARGWEYTHRAFKNGVLIPRFARTLWREVDGDGDRWPDPLSTENPEDFFHWLNRPAAGTGKKGAAVMTNLAMELYRRRPDVQRSFPRLLNEDREAFARWFVAQGCAGEKIDPLFAAPLKTKAPGRGDGAGSPASAAVRKWGIRVYHFIRGRVDRWGLLSRLRLLLGDRRILRLQELLLRDGRGNPRLGMEPLPGRGAPPSPGVTVIGYLRDESGVGEAGRLTLKALKSVETPLSQVTLGGSASRKEEHGTLRIPAGANHDVNIVHVNADQVPFVFENLGPEVFQGRRNIGVWFWELSRFPARWGDRFYYFHEIWAASAFIEKALAAASPVPVKRLLLPVIAPPRGEKRREDFGIPGDAFVFLFVFDALSFLERKNPFGVISAFRSAFGKSPDRVRLVLKAANMDRHPALLKALRAELETVSGILIDASLDRREVASLFHLCDAYVSLHRSEGFGLTLAEAMAIGKPVVATGYSGNMDFMSEDNSYLVPYRLAEIKTTAGPYERGETWADPDLEEAAGIFQRIVEHPFEASARGERARADMTKHRSLAAGGARILELLNRRPGAGPAPRRTAGRLLGDLV